MDFFLIRRLSTITVPDHKTLRAAWQTYGCSGSRTDNLVGTYIVEKPLTDSQLRRLPGRLRARLKVLTPEEAKQKVISIKKKTKAA